MTQNNEDKKMKMDPAAAAPAAAPEGAAGTGAPEKPEGKRVVRKVVKKQPQKKSKIIIVTGGGDSNNAGGRTQRSSGSYSSGQRGGYGSGAGGQQRGNGRAGGGSRSYGSSAPAGNGGTYHPIKPKTAPSQMSGDYHKPIPRSEQPKPATVSPVAEEAAAVTPQDVAMAGVHEDVIQPGAGEGSQGTENISVRAGSPAAQDAIETPDAGQVAAQEPSRGAKSGTAPADEGWRGNGAAVPSADNTAHNDRENAAGSGHGVQGESGRERTQQTRSEHGRAEQGASYHRDRDGSRTTDRSRGQGSGRQGGYGAQGRTYGQGGQDRNGAASRGQGSGRQGGYGAQGRTYGQGGQNRSGAASRGQGSGRQGGYGAQGRTYGQGGQNRSGAASRGQGGFGGQDFGSSGQNKRRQNGAAAKDRHSRRDTVLDQNEQRERRNRSGRFIRPVMEKVSEPEEQIRVITIPEKLTIGALAEAMHLKPAELIKKLFLSGKAMTVNSEVTYEEAENIAADYDILCEKEEKVDVIQELLKEDADPEETLVTRPPVICVMGHVDHGKTSILDYIRKTRVTEKEAGGITQAIGAYTVEVQDRVITFLDTPGHEAFTAMRLRGAKSTDIAVLVIAADDGVMPQTVEAINHARAAGVEIIVALNKIDKPDADPERVKQQLSKYELIPTDWGGSTEFVNVSAKTGEGIDDLLDTILLQADIMELRANPDRLARGLVLEARLDRGRGPVANVLVQKGTLHIGDYISAGPAFGRVRAMINDKGQNVKEAKPSEPVVVLGLSEVPSAGEVLVGHPTNDEAKSYAQTYKAQHKEELVEENVMSMNVEDLFDQMREGKMKELGLIVKADVQGSVEALCASLLKLSNDEVRVRIIHSAAGAITESDVDLAAASNAAIIGFNVQPNSIAKSNAEHNGVSLHLYKVIYQAIDDVDAALKGMLAPVYEEKVIGHAEVRALFKSGRIGNIAGCMVLDGVVERDAQVRISRSGEQVFEGDLASLKRFKDDVREVRAGYDCGMVFRDYDSMLEGDQIEVYRMVEVPREEVIARREREDAKKARETRA